MCVHICACRLGLQARTVQYQSHVGHRIGAGLHTGERRSTPEFAKCHQGLLANLASVLIGCGHLHTHTPSRPHYQHSTSKLPSRQWCLQGHDGCCNQYVALVIALVAAMAEGFEQHLERMQHPAYQSADLDSQLSLQLIRAPVQIETVREIA